MPVFSFSSGAFISVTSSRFLNTLSCMSYRFCLTDSICIIPSFTEISGPFALGVHPSSDFPSKRLSDSFEFVSAL